MNFLKKLLSKIRFVEKKHSIPLGVILLSIGALIHNRRNSLIEIKLSYFLLGLRKNTISEVIIQGIYAYFRVYNQTKWFKTDITMIPPDTLMEELINKPQVMFQAETNTATNLAPTLILCAAYGILGMFLSIEIQNLSTSKLQNKQTDKSISFDDIYGLNQAKEEIQQIVNHLWNPQQYQKIGARLRRGVLLHGPPGTGKTMLAKAAAQKVNFISVSAAEFIEIYVGVGPKRVRELFQKARQKAPCIIFIDEIDSIAQKRGNEEGHGERESTLNQLLTEIDGFNENENIVIIAATNRIAVLDTAFLRSGRFDTKIKINMPTAEERLGIFKIHLKNKPNNINEELLMKLSQQGEGLSGADIENITNESVYLAIDQQRQIVENDDILKAFSSLLKQKFQR